ncbi:AMP-binding protein, partial [Pararhodobacter zhoushanensis]
GGTTGKARAAILTHRNLSAATLIYSEWFRSEAHAGPGQSVLTYSPLFHILGLTTNLLRRVAEGGLVYLRQRFDAAEAVDLIERHRIGAFGGVPTTWIAVTQLPDIDRRDLTSLSYAGSGGAPLPVEVERRVRQLTGLALRGGWGMTETAPSGTNIPVQMPEGKAGTIGIPLPGVEVQIVALDDPRRVLGAGETGELRVRGPNVTAGYHNCPDETREAFVDGWLLTGDVGHRDADGFFFLTDRKKELIVSSGFNIYPLTLENAIHEHPDVADVAVIGIPHPYRGEAAKAFVVLRPGAQPLSLPVLLAFLNGRLGRHEMPAELELRAALPRTAVGKTSRRDLRDEEIARRAAV